MRRRLPSIDVRRTYTRSQTLARLLAIRQALDIIVRVVISSGRATFTGSEIADQLKSATR